MPSIGASTAPSTNSAPPNAFGRFASPPDLDPVVYRKMLLVGFFEGLPNPRAIAARCATEQQYWEYVKRLAADAGVDGTDAKEVRDCFVAELVVCSGEWMLWPHRKTNLAQSAPVSGSISLKSEVFQRADSGECQTRGGGGESLPSLHGRVLPTMPCDRSFHERGSHCRPDGWRRRCASAGSSRQ